MDKFLKAYLDRADEIVGDRSSEEIAYDNAVVEALNQGWPIEAALKAAAAKYPGEALEWDQSNLDDIPAHYDYLKEHQAMLAKIGNRNG